MRRKLNEPQLMIKKSNVGTTKRRKSKRIPKEARSFHSSGKLYECVLHVQQGAFIISEKASGLRVFAYLLLANPLTGVFSTAQALPARVVVVDVMVLVLPAAVVSTTQRPQENGQAA